MPPRLRSVTHGLKILSLGFSIALDELAVGFTFGLIHINTGLAIILIAAQALLVAQIGLRLGSRLGEARGERAEKLAGAALTAYGAYLLISHEASLPARSASCSSSSRSIESPTTISTAPARSSA